MPSEIRVDCPQCKVEGARIETWVATCPSERLGVPSSAECRLCGYRETGRTADADEARSGVDGGDRDGGDRDVGACCPGCGSRVDDATLEAHRCPFCGARAVSVVTSPGRVPTHLDALRASLDVWARAEGLASADELIEGYFVLPTLEAIRAALARGEAVETTFDVVDYLFASGHGQSAGDAVASSTERHEAPRVASPPSVRPALASAFTPSAPSPFAPPSVRPAGGPRDELLALASVAASDGEASAEDLAVLAQAAAARGLPPLAPEEIRVRRPAEIDAPATLVARERLLQEMFQIAWSDDDLDESEIRVVREFARAWGVDPQRVTEWTTIATSRGSSRVARWIDRVGYFLFPGW